MPETLYPALADVCRRICELKRQRDKEPENVTVLASLDRMQGVLVAWPLKEHGALFTLELKVSSLEIVLEKLCNSEKELVRAIEMEPENNGCAAWHFMVGDYIENLQKARKLYAEINKLSNDAIV